jgi:hypothetical protein
MIKSHSSLGADMAISTSSMNGDLLVDEDAEVCTTGKK